jgi:hypothetical protein
VVRLVDQRRHFEPGDRRIAQHPFQGPRVASGRDQAAQRRVGVRFGRDQQSVAAGHG